MFNVSEKRYACLVALSQFDQTCSKAVLLGNICMINNLINKLLSSGVNYFIKNVIIAFCLNLAVGRVDAFLIGQESGTCKVT